MKKACSVCLSNCLRLHGAQGKNEDVAACSRCASRRPEDDEHRNQQRTQADRNPSFLKKMAKSNMSTLKLPLSFVRDQIDRLEGSVILEGPSRGKWRVKLQGSFQSFSLNFGQGWEKFVADHVLQVDDLLTFSLSAKSYFQVEVYDGGGCLKTSALDADVDQTEVAEVARPVMKAVRPVAEVVHAARPAAEAARPAAEAGRPAAEAARPAAEAARPAAEAGRPAAEAARPAAEAARPAAEAARPAAEAGRPAAEAGRPAAEAARPVAEATSPVAEATSPVAEAARPAAEAARPAAHLAEAAKPVLEVVQEARSVSEVAEAARCFAGVSETEVETARFVADVAQAARSVAEVVEMEVAEAARPKGLDDPDSGDGLIKLAKSEQGGPEESEQGGLLPEHLVIGGSVLSRRRPVTELETERALQAAESLEPANPNILLVLNKCNVYKCFWLTLPKQFSKEWMPSKNKGVKIVNKGGNSWPANWYARRRGLGSGWRRFSLDHRLEEHDVCVLELIDKANYVLLVHIFRVLWCPGEDQGLYTPSLDKRKRKESFDCHEAGGNPGEGSQRKSSQRVGHKEKLTLKPDSAAKTRKPKSGLLGDDTVSPGDVAVLRDGSGAGKQGESRAAESTSTVPQRSLFGDDMASPGDAVLLRDGSGAGEQGESRATEGTTTSQQVLATSSFGQNGHKAYGTLGEGSGRKRKRSRRDGREGNRKRRLNKVSVAKGKELVSPDHGETSDAELLVNIIQKSANQVSPKNRAGDAGDEVALRACGARDKVEPQQVLALVCYNDGKPPDQTRSVYQLTEHSFSTQADFFPVVQHINPVAVHEQILHAPVTRPFRRRKKEKRHKVVHNPDEVHEQIFHPPVNSPFIGRKKEKRQEYKVVHIYGGRNVGNGTEFLVELEGYSEGRSSAYLDRDDDTGFWWVPSEQFGWDMMRCYIG